MWPTSSANPKEAVILALKILLVFLVIAAGLSLRFDDLRIWEKRKNIWYLDDNRPIFTSYDAFYFARLARDWQEGRYRSGKPDPYRFVPDNYLTENVTYPFPIPLMSLSAAKLSDWLGIPLEKVALYYTPITAVLFVIPLFLYLESLGYTAAGLLGGLCGVTAFIYVIRTSIGRFDTDSLNLFFPILIAWALFMYFRGRRPLVWAGVASAGAFLYYWWYAHPHLILVQFLIFVFLLYRERGGRRELLRRDWWAIGILFLPNLWYLWKSPVALFKQIFELILSIASSAQTGIFRDYPNILQSISELQKTKSVTQVAALTVQNRFFFVPGLLGALGLLLRERKALAYLWPYFVIGLLVFRSGNRFAMYLAPFVGMGLGFLVHILVEKSLPRLGLDLSSSLRNLLVLLVMVVVGVIVFGGQRSSRAYVPVPKANSFVARDMEKLSRILPEGAWIWSWWDYGYAFVYLSRRAVFIDGGSQTTPKTYYVALSFASSSPEEARNITAFVAREGKTGLKKLLEEGHSAEEITDSARKGRFYAPPEHPVYWVFTQDLPPKYGWIGYFGTWDFRTRRGHFGLVLDLAPCRRMGRGQVLLCRRGIRVDLAAHRVYLGGRSYNISRMVFKTPEGVHSRSFGERGFILEVVPTRYGETLFLVDERSFKSNFNQMYILRRYDPRYFDLVMDDFPFMVVYRVKWKP
ncbi:STT3 domain-containing protein [Thermosulfurimonas sp. F29]|uniref:STT3 domain-containing protein n=1 Tax=Thermosulfurimonas sp. F29 TaxID=2867247 RepID=UPI001C83C5C2|nr:STT3 domain-containing protein [Thermosulfurimonas sp. F29]MBX6423477.1 hypothetical protein [Thermosulfurimonas sp. F29]